MDKTVKHIILFGMSVLAVLALVASCAPTPNVMPAAKEPDLTEQVSNCLAMNGSPSYMVTGSTTKFECKVRGGL